MLRYAITSGIGTGAQDLAAQAAQWAANGLDFVQLRVPTLSAGELYAAARAMLAAIDSSHAPAPTKLLVNARADVALAARAHGVHLTSRPGELTPAQVRALYALAGLPAPIVAVSCHTLDEVRRARDQQASFLVFGPVFEKRVHSQRLADGSGLDLLAAACAAAQPIPVLALGGITAHNALDCIAHGASGIAAIRLFAPSR